MSDQMPRLRWSEGKKGSGRALAHTSAGIRVIDITYYQDRSIAYVTKWDYARRQWRQLEWITIEIPGGANDLVEQARVRMIAYCALKAMRLFWRR